MFMSGSADDDKVVKYHSNRNCFLYIDSQFKMAANITDNVFLNFNDIFLALMETIDKQNFVESRHVS